jgi:glycosyltransferase involved in cell wall biosynthesis
MIRNVEGAELHADVPDPTVLLRQAHVAVNPAVSGSGVNIKLVDYLAAGVPVVSTRRGMTGLGLSAGRDLMVADEPKAFGAAVLSLIADLSAAERLGSTGRQTALSILDVDASLRRMGTLLAPARG